MTKNARDALNPQLADTAGSKRSTGEKQANEDGVNKQPLRGLTWLITSSSDHMTHCREAFIEYTPLSTPIALSDVTGAVMEAVGTGTVLIDILIGERQTAIKVSNVLHVPGLDGSHLSLLKIVYDNDIFPHYVGGKKMLLKRGEKVVAVAMDAGRGYTFVSPPGDARAAASPSRNSLDLGFGESEINIVSAMSLMRVGAQ